MNQVGLTWRLSTTWNFVGLMMVKVLMMSGMPPWP